MEKETMMTVEKDYLEWAGHRIVELEAQLADCKAGVEGMREAISDLRKERDRQARRLLMLSILVQRAQAEIEELEAQLQRAAQLAFQSEVVDAEMWELETPTDVSLKEYKEDWICDWLKALEMIIASSRRS